MPKRHASSTRLPWEVCSGPVRVDSSSGAWMTSCRACSTPRRRLSSCRRCPCRLSSSWTSGLPEAGQSCLCQGDGPLVGRPAGQPTRAGDRRGAVCRSVHSWRVLSRYWIVCLYATSGDASRPRLTQRTHAGCGQSVEAAGTQERQADTAEEEHSQDGPRTEQKAVRQSAVEVDMGLGQKEWTSVYSSCDLPSQYSSLVPGRWGMPAPRPSLGWRDRPPSRWTACCNRLESRRSMEQEVAVCHMDQRYA